MEIEAILEPKLEIQEGRATFTSWQIKPQTVTLLDVSWTNRATSLLDLHGRVAKHWWTNSLSADRFAVISAVARSAFVSLPQLSLSVVFLCHCVVALARRFHNYAKKI